MILFKMNGGYLATEETGLFIKISRQHAKSRQSRHRHLMVAPVSKGALNEVCGHIPWPSQILSVLFSTFYAERSAILEIFSLLIKA